MKIGIITFHFVSNHGGVLQCYALQEFLKKNGHDVYVINYRPKYHTVRYSTKKNPFMYARGFWKKFSKKKLSRRLYLTVRSFFRAIYMNIKNTDKGVDECYKTFIENNLQQTRKYTSLKQLQNNPPIVDAYISGSDQLWNPELLDQKFDEAYFLDFGIKDVPHITYAVSMGKKISEEYILQLQELCKGLSAISLREYSEGIEEAIDQDLHICIDPTLLLDASDYASVESNDIETEPYIFVYGFETNENIKNAVEVAVKKYNCRVINGSPHRVKLQFNAKNVRVYGPDKFLSYIKNAQCVVTNSFHGTVFSLIYKNDFITVSHSTRGKRMNDLLGKLNLTCRLFTGSEFNINESIDYETVYEKLLALRKGSIEYLTNAINGVQGKDIPHYPEEKQEFVFDDCVQVKFKTYYGYYSEESKLKECASGGVATALAEMIVKKGGVCFGVQYDDDFKKARYAMAETQEQLAKFKGSKYIYSDKKMKTEYGYKLVFEVVGEKLDEGREVLFIGLGCDIGALLKYLSVHNIDDENLYTVDLICHGPAREVIQKCFVEDLEEKYNSRVTFINTRYKIHGWNHAYLLVRFENGKQFCKPLYETDLGFALKYYSRESCYNCKFKGTNHKADITVGDFWGLNPKMKEYRRNGVSIMFVGSEKGLLLLEALGNDSFEIHETTQEYPIIHNPMFIHSAKKPGFYADFEKDLEKYGLQYAVKHSSGYRIYRKAALKNRLNMLLRRK